MGKKEKKDAKKEKKEKKEKKDAKKEKKGVHAKTKTGGEEKAPLSSLLQQKILARALSRKTSNTSHLSGDKDTLMRDSMKAMEKICSPSFLFYHVVLGDHTMADSTSHGVVVDYGDRETFHEKVLSTLHIGKKLHPAYDYDQVVQKDQEDSEFIKKFDKEFNLTHRLDEIEGRVPPSAGLELTGHA